jgi:hypothetical protein
MNKARITYGTTEQSKEESLIADIQRSPAERIKLFLTMSEFYLKLYPPAKPLPDHNFHIYPK